MYKEESHKAELLSLYPFGKNETYEEITNENSYDETVISRFVSEKGRENEGLIFAHYGDFLYQSGNADFCCLHLFIKCNVHMQNN